MTIRKTGIGWLTALMLISGCQSQVASDDPFIHQQEAVSEVIIPASLLDFANTDIEENAESARDYCTEVRQQDGNLILVVTEAQRKALIEMNQEEIDDVIHDAAQANPLYSITINEDSDQIIFAYDEQIDGLLQARMLLSVTTLSVFNDMLQGGSTDWHREVVVRNCHTGKTVASGTLPEQTIAFDMSAWQASYE